MKKISLLFLCCIAFTVFSSVPISAAYTATPTDTTIVRTYDDGSYIQSTIEELPIITPFSTTSKKTGKNTCVYKSSSGKVL